MPKDYVGTPQISLIGPNRVENLNALNLIGLSNKTKLDDFGNMFRDSLSLSPPKNETIKSNGWKSTVLLDGAGFSKDDTVYINGVECNGTCKSYISEKNFKLESEEKFPWTVTVKQILGSRVFSESIQIAGQAGPTLKFANAETFKVRKQDTQYLLEVFGEGFTDIPTEDFCFMKSVTFTCSPPRSANILSDTHATLLVPGDQEFWTIKAKKTKNGKTTEISTTIDLPDSIKQERKAAATKATKEKADARAKKEADQAAAAKEKELSLGDVKILRIASLDTKNDGEYQLDILINGTGFDSRATKVYPAITADKTKICQSSKTATHFLNAKQISHIIKVPKSLTEIPIIVANCITDEDDEMSAKTVGTVLKLLEAPTITGVINESSLVKNKACGFEGGGDEVILTGQNLIHVTKVKFGKKTATVISKSDDQIKVKTPPGKGKVIVKATAKLPNSNIVQPMELTPEPVKFSYHNYKGCKKIWFE